MNAGDLNRISTALAYIPPDDRDLWLKMAMAIKSEVGESGFEVWDQWSQGANSYVAKDATAVWKSVEGNGAITGSTLFFQAKQHGWRDDQPLRKRARKDIAAQRRESSERAESGAKAKVDEQEQAAIKAAELWKRAPLVPDDHVYLLKKNITAHGTRVFKGDIIVPMYDGAKLHSLQFIKATGEKKFLAGGRTSDCYFVIGQPDKTICICEGFATGASIYQATGYATTIAFSAGNLLSVGKTMRRQYPDFKIILCADDDHRTKDNPGLTKATEAARAIGGMLAIPDFVGDRPEDFSDFNDMRKHFGSENIGIVISNARAPHDGNNISPAANATTPGDTAKTEWPVLEEAALYGLPGDIVRAIAPHTEADQAALLIQVLTVFGSYIGRGCHVPIEGDQHHANLFCVLVGKTAKSRKGTSWSRVRELFSGLDDCVPSVSGLSSGEGLKYHVRDAVEGKEGKGGDPGVHDKRLLVLEPEFAQVLRTSSRSGNTLSAVIRESWDTGTLRTLTKNDPVTATGAHVSIIGHITKDELRSELTESDKGNGFANRFLFVCVDRSKRLPWGGGEIPTETVTKLQGLLTEAKRKATNHAITKPGGIVSMTASAMAIWEDQYAELSEGFDGLLGSVTARAESQVRRIAMIYALMDGLQAVDSDHLLAALALWRYSEQSARCVFGSALGNRVADEILRALRVAGQSGMTKTEINNLFKRNESADRIGAALVMLKERQMATNESRNTGGRPTEVWRVY